MRRSDLKVGLFVLMGLVLACTVVFLLGGTRHTFERSVHYQLVFDDVAGIKQGAPVHMGGVHVGQVVTVDYSKDAGDPRVYVKVRIVAEAARRLRTDSVASIVNKGFLGDKMLVVTKGSAEPLADGGTIVSEEPADFIAKIGEFGGEAGAAVSEVQRLAKSFADEKLHADLRSSVKRVDQ
ncbi:MAG: MCE family protein, partial [Myxococcales bacterium]|nr:MCE family protein [Myxococcales bacterium]